MLWNKHWARGQSTRVYTLSDFQFANAIRQAIGTHHPDKTHHPMLERRPREGVTYKHCVRMREQAERFPN